MRGISINPGHNLQRAQLFKEKPFLLLDELILKKLFESWQKSFLCPTQAQGSMASCDHLTMYFLKILGSGASYKPRMFRVYLKQGSSATYI